MHPHLHLLFNHFPIIGTVLAAGILIAGYILKNNTVKNVALGLFFVVALISVAAYFSGGAAEEATEGQTWYEEAVVEEHEKAGFWGFILVEIAGLLSALALYLSLKNKKYHQAVTGFVLVFSFVVIAAMYRAGDTGGEIRHIEVRKATSTTQQQTKTDHSGSDKDD